MAFLCPSRLGRNKHKRGYYSMVRKLTEGGSIDTITLADLVKLSWTTPDSRRIILQNFSSCEPQEITVKQGQKVNYIYREGDWAYIVTDDKKEGFVPFTFIAKIGVPSKPAQKIIDTGTYTKRVGDLNPRNFSVESEETDHSGSDLADDSFTSTAWSSDSASAVTMQERPSVNYLETETIDKPLFYEVFLDERTNILHKNPLPQPGTYDESQLLNQADEIGKPSFSVQFKVLYNFAGQDVYDVPVKTGETVHLLDDSDPGWFWIRKLDGTEGFVPSNYITEVKEFADKTDKESMRNKCNPADNIKPDDRRNKDVKSNKTEIPINWKVTNDLRGKIPPSSPAVDSTEIDTTKKQKPKKPPRKKKTNSEGLSPRLDESIDSIDTCITDDSTDYLDYRAKSSCDELSPRSTDFSDQGSVFDSSFNGVYNSRQCVNTFSDTELSPGSLGVHVHECDEKIDSRQHVVETNNRNEVNSVHKHENHKTGQYARYTSCENGNSFESKSSCGQRHKRPVSMPGFKSHHECKKGYFDEYFYDDNDTKFASRSKHDVVNVAEILKMRKTNEQRRHSLSSEKYRSYYKQCQDDRNVVGKKSTPEHKTHLAQYKHGDNELNGNCNTRCQPKFKQFLFNLPSTTIESQTGHMEQPKSKNHSNMNDENAGNKDMKQQTRKIYNSSSDVPKQGNETKRDALKNQEIERNTQDKNAIPETYSNKKAMRTQVRQYNSSTDLTQIDAKNLTGNGGYNKANNQNSNVSRNKEASNVQMKTHLRPYNSSTDLREIGGKPDWSFGYPRRARQSIGRKGNERQANDVTNGSIRSAKDTSNRKGKIENETEEIKQNNFEVRLSNGNSVKQEVSTRKSDYSASSNDCGRMYNGEDLNEDFGFNDEAMTKLLKQTDNLLDKTDKLLHTDHDKNKTKHLGRQVMTKFLVQNDMSDETHKLKNTGDQNSNVEHDTASQTESINTNGDDKCFLFLNNSTIGIHGMTYFVTKEGEMNSQNTCTNTLDENDLNSEILCSSLYGVENESHDTRKEKSKVMKDNSSKMVSAELKSLDLQDIRGITEFVCQCDFDRHTDDMLPIKYGEILHIGLDGQDNGDCYWAFSPRLKKYGFVSKQHVKIPMVTII